MIRLSRRDGIEVGDDGRFRAGLGEGEWRVLAMTADGAAASARPRPDRGRGDGARRNSRSRLRRTTPVASSSRSGSPAEPRRAGPRWRSPEEGARVQTLTNGEGRARVRRPPSATMVLMASKGGRVSPPVEVAPGDEDGHGRVAARVPPPEGASSAADGVPPRGFTLRRRDAAGGGGEPGGGDPAGIRGGPVRALRRAVGTGPSRGEGCRWAGRRRVARPLARRAGGTGHPARGGRARSSSGPSTPPGSPSMAPTSPWARG